MVGLATFFGTQPLWLPDIVDFICTGAVSPDCTGGYTEDGLWHGQPVYRQIDGPWWNWLDLGGVNRHVSLVPGEYGAAYWNKGGSGVTGLYDPAAGASGEATFSNP
jgi:hypothetical protein